MYMIRQSVIRTAILHLEHLLKICQIHGSVHNVVWVKTSFLLKNKTDYFSFPFSFFKEKGKALLTRFAI